MKAKETLILMNKKRTSDEVLQFKSGARI